MGRRNKPEVKDIEVPLEESKVEVVEPENLSEALDEAFDELNKPGVEPEESLAEMTENAGKIMDEVLDKPQQSEEEIIKEVEDKVNDAIDEVKQKAIDDNIAAQKEHSRQQRRNSVQGLAFGIFTSMCSDGRSRPMGLEPKRVEMANLAFKAAENFLDVAEKYEYKFEKEE